MTSTTHQAAICRHLLADYDKLEHILQNLIANLRTPSR